MTAAGSRVAWYLLAPAAILLDVLPILIMTGR